MTRQTRRRVQSAAEAATASVGSGSGDFFALLAEEEEEGCSAMGANTESAPMEEREPVVRRLYASTECRRESVIVTERTLISIRFSVQKGKTCRATTTAQLLVGSRRRRVLRLHLVVFAYHDIFFLTSVLSSLSCRVQVEDFS